MAGFARSCSDVTPLGSFGATAICNVFVANFCGAAAVSPGSVTFFMLLSSAEANTSAGAPLVICVARSDEPANVSFTSVPGLACSNCFSSVPNVSLSEAAANTFSVWPWAAGALPCAAPPLSPPPHPARASINDAAAT